MEKQLINQDSGYISAQGTPDGVRKLKSVGKWFSTLKSKRADDADQAVTQSPSTQAQSQTSTPKLAKKFNLLSLLGKQKSEESVTQSPKSGRSFKQFLTIKKTSQVSLETIEHIQFEQAVDHPQSELFKAQRKLGESEEQCKLVAIAFDLLTSNVKVEYALMALRDRSCQITHLLGIGAYGIVMAGRYDGRKVAVKFMVSRFLSSSQWVKTADGDYIPFESHVLSKLNHPNITKFVDAFSVGMFTVLITELHGAEWNFGNPLIQHLPLPSLAAYKRKYDGQYVPIEHKYTKEEEAVFKRRSSLDLFECIEVHQRIPERTAMNILKQLAQVEKYLLDIGLVHRDYKDENIVIDENYNIKLIDFGSCALLPPKHDKSKWFDMFHGTVLYAPPELLGAKSKYKYRGPEAQIWSMGVLLYVMLHGDNPFTHQQAILDYYHQKQQLKMSKSLNPKIQKLLHGMLHREPSHRPAVKSVLHAIDDYLSQS